MRKLRKNVGLGVGALTLALVLAGCTTTSSNEGSGGHASRVELYSSVAELANASPEIVVGQVDNQTVAADIDDITDFTLSEIAITDVVKSSSGLEVGDTVTVRQIGSSDLEPPAPLLKTLSTYLLYLTPSGLEGELGSQFYVTGGNAGLYAASNDVQPRSSAPAYEQLQSTPGENLPQVISEPDALG